MKEPSVDELIREFSYRIQPTDIQRELMAEIKAYYEENEKFQKRWNKEAGKRARKHLLKMYHLCRARRQEICDFIYREDEIECQ